MFTRTSLVLVLALAISACGKAPGTPQKGAAAPASPILVPAEDVITVRSSSLASGPSITGSIQPERRADLRAEVSAIVLRVAKENGEAVKRGDLLVQLDSTAITDALNSAEAASRAATQSYEQAQRQYERLRTLRTSGMASAQQLEDAEIRRNNTQSAPTAARSRRIRSPWRGRR